MKEEKRKKSRKDRKDARYIKTTPMARLMTYLKERQDADVYINKKIDCTELVKYMKKKKVKEPETTFFHAFTMACAKTVYNRPKLNRYIIDHKCYERYDVVFSFVAKTDYKDDSKEFMVCLKVDKDDTIDDIRNKIKERVSKVRNNVQGESDDSLDILDKLPNWLLKLVVVPIFKWLDRHDHLPKKLATDFIYNSTMILSNLGSIKCGAIYHNITDFGTNSILTTIGDIHKEPMVIDGKIEIRDVVELGINLDERIADGVYFSKAVNLLEHILTHPQLLEEKASERIEEKKDFEY